MELYLVDENGNIYEGVRSSVKSAELIVRHEDEYYGVMANLETLEFEAQNISKVAAQTVAITQQMLDEYQRARRVVLALAEEKARQENMTAQDAYEKIMEEFAE